MTGTQIFLTIGAITLFGLLVLNVNRTIMGSEEQKLYSEYFIAATSVAQGLMYEIKDKNFDKNVSGEPDVDVNALTHPNQFGAPQNTPASTFTAVEQYHNYTRIVETPRAGNFTAFAQVQYVNDNDFQQVLSTQSRTKRITVYVTSPFLVDTLSLKTYKSY